jgi:hypothetical protein
MLIELEMLRLQKTQLQLHVDIYTNQNLYLRSAVSAQLSSVMR